MRQTAPTLEPGQKSALRPALLDHIGDTPLLRLDHRRGSFPGGWNCWPRPST